MIKFLPKATWSFIKLHLCLIILTVNDALKTFFTRALDFMVFIALFFGFDKTFKLSNIMCPFEANLCSTNLNLSITCKKIVFIL